MIRKIREAIEKNHLLEGGEKVVVAVSGGADSVALLRVLSMLSREYGLTLIAAHLNHGLRAEAAREEQFVCRMAKDMGIAFESKYVDIALLRKGTGKCIEDISREVRYDFLVDVANKHGARRIALGHHMNDQTETVLINFLRGSGPAGLKGMLPARDATYIRPLLGVTRSEIISFLEFHAIPYVTDLSNTDQRYLRNRVRHSLIPGLKAGYNPNLEESMRSMADIMRVEDDYMKMMTAKALSAWGAAPADTEITISISDLGEHHEAIQRRIMKHILLVLSRNSKGIGYAHIKAALDLVSSDRPGAYVSLPCDIEVRREYDALVICRREKGKRRLLNEESNHLYYEVTLPGSAKISELGRTMIFEFVEPPADIRSAGPEVVFMDYDCLSPPLIIRHARPGDRMQPLGMTGMKKIKRLLIDEKIPLHHRRAIPLLTDQEAVLWIPGLRLSERVKITERTRRILKVEFV